MRYLVTNRIFCRYYLISKKMRKIPYKTQPTQISSVQKLKVFLSSEVGLNTRAKEKKEKGVTYKTWKIKTTTKVVQRKIKPK